MQLCALRGRIRIEPILSRDHRERLSQIEASRPLTVRRYNGGVRLDRKDRAMLQIVKKKPDDSPLYNVSKSGIMPPGGTNLTHAEVETLRKWFAEEAPWPNGAELAATNRIK